jgi:hypothetical protein
VPIQPLISLEQLSAPLAPALPPSGAHGACDSSVSPKIPLRYYSTVATGASKAAGRSPWSVGVFWVQNGCTFFKIRFGHAIFTSFHFRKSFLDSGAELVHYPFFFLRNSGYSDIPNFRSRY